MSTYVGDRIPPPLRFDLGKPAAPGETAQGVLLATVDEDGSPRVAVLAGSEVRVAGDRNFRIVIRSAHATCANLLSRPHASLWCVLDGAAYTIHASSAADGEVENDLQTVDFTVNGVWCDFRPEAPLIAGPTYRIPAVD